MKEPLRALGVILPLLFFPFLLFFFFYFLCLFYCFIPFSLFVVLLFLRLDSISYPLVPLTYRYGCRGVWGEATQRPSTNYFCEFRLLPPSLPLSLRPSSLSKALSPPFSLRLVGTWASEILEPLFPPLLPPLPPPLQLQSALPVPVLPPS